jgi:hypothetical protein
MSTNRTKRSNDGHDDNDGHDCSGIRRSSLKDNDNYRNSDSNKELFINGRYQIVEAIFPSVNEKEDNNNSNNANSNNNKNNNNSHGNSSSPHSSLATTAALHTEKLFVPEYESELSSLLKHKQPQKLRDNHLPEDNRNKKNSKKTARRKTSITLAIDELVLQEIKEEAKQGIGIGGIGEAAAGVGVGSESTIGPQSVNSKVNQILSRYLSLYKYVERERCMLVPSKYWRAIVDSIDEEMITDEFRAFVSDIIVVDLFENNKVSLSLNSWIKCLFKGVYSNGGAIEKFSYYKDEQGCLCLVFRHNHGVKWSKVISKVFTEQLESLFKYHVRPIVLPSVVVLNILEKDAAAEAVGGSEVDSTTDN